MSGFFLLCWKGSRWSKNPIKGMDYQDKKSTWKRKKLASPWSCWAPIGLAVWVPLYPKSQGKKEARHRWSRLQSGSIQTCFRYSLYMKTFISVGVRTLHALFKSTILQVMICVVTHFSESVFLAALRRQRTGGFLSHPCCDLWKSSPASEWHRKLLHMKHRRRLKHLSQGETKP